MSKLALHTTSNYSLFDRSEDNRPLDVDGHAKLLASMQKHGFLKSFPLSVFKGKRGVLVVMDGQHRLAVAQSLGIPVYYVIEDEPFDVAELNATVKAWRVKDYAQKHAANGNADYEEGLRFAAEHKVAASLAFSLLGGAVNYSSVKDAFEGGAFKVTAREWAADIAALFSGVARLNPKVRTACFLKACMAVCRVKGFDRSRMIAAAERCREKLIPYATRDGYLDMLEAVYNFHRGAKVPLKFMAAEVSKANAIKNLAPGGKRPA